VAERRGVARITAGGDGGHKEGEVSRRSGEVNGQYDLNAAEKALPILGRLDQGRPVVAGQGALASDFEDAMANMPVLGDVRGGGIIEFDPAINGAAL
jgi:hypothetical protein